MAQREYPIPPRAPRVLCDYRPSYTSRVSVSRALGAIAAILLMTAAVTGQSATPPTYDASHNGPSVLLPNADGSSPYAGIVRYAGRAQCSGVFLDTIPVGQDPGRAPAYVLTNGHCSDFPGANEVLPDRPAPQSHRVVFNYFADTQRQQVTVAVTRIVYATMKGRDLAILELAAPYEEIVRRGFRPWRVSATPPAADEPIVVVGAPLLADASASFLRLATCARESRAPVVLEFIWHWFDADRNRCADIHPGSSGSPVLSRVSGRLLGLVNTTTIGAVRFTECFLDHPCEPSRAGIVSKPDTSYVTPLDRIDRCFDGGGRFDARLPGCPLDRGVQAGVSPSTLGAQNPRRDTTPFGPARTRWDVTVSGPFEVYRYNIVRAAEGDCRDPREYGPARRVRDRPLIDDALPRDDGDYFLCVVGGSETGGAWQSVEHPTIVAVRIDSTPPRIPARININEGDSSWSLTFRALDPEVSIYTVKFGRPGETRCADPSGYRTQLVPILSLSKANRPYVFCAIPHDSAGNAGEIFETIFP
jgi:hypothetical protein